MSPTMSLQITEQLGYSSSMAGGSPNGSGRRKVGVVLGLLPEETDAARISQHPNIGFMVPN